MKKTGHYCKICGEHKANEKFSAKAMRLTSAKAALLCPLRNAIRQ